MRKITKFEYKREMAWAVFWFNVWCLWSFLRLPEFDKNNKLNPVFGWIISQTGFMYMWEYEKMKDIEWDI